MRNNIALVENKPEKFNFQPRNLDEAMKIADIISKSGLCPKGLESKPHDILLIIMMGEEVGFKVNQSLRTIGCINGRTFLYGDGLLALVKNHPDFVDIKEWIEGDINLETAIAYCTIFRKNQEPQTRSFSVSDAKKAYLWKKEKTPWITYPKRMLQHRARSFACRDVFPDALFGLMSKDEVEEINAPFPLATVTPIAKGMKGFKETIGIEKEENIIEQPQEVSKLETLKNLIKSLNLEEKYKDKNFDSLTEDKLQKWIDHLKPKEENT